MTATNFIWDFATDSYLMEKDDSGVTTVVYTIEPRRFGKLVSQHRSGVASYFEFDAQGSTRTLSAEDGSVTDSHTYTAFGEIVTSSGITLHCFRYVGRFGYYSDVETTSTRTNVRARTYVSVIARWISLDPLNGRPEPTRRGVEGLISGYMYCGNGPVNWSDPSGLKVEVCCRVTDLPILKWTGEQHCFVKTNTKSIGRGGCLCKTQQTDHSKEVQSRLTCQPPEQWSPYGGPPSKYDHYYNCDEACVNRQLNVGQPIGVWFPLLDDCITFVFGILSKCCKIDRLPPHEDGYGFPTTPW